MKNYALFPALIFVNTLLANIYLGDTQSIQSNIYTDKSKNLSMIKETVHIYLNKDNIRIQAKFWINNSGKKRTSNVCFPDVKTYTLETRDHKDIANFKCIIDNKEYEVDKKTIKAFKNYTMYKNFYEVRDWYKWKMMFPGNDTTLIEVEYDSKWGYSYRNNTQFFQYLIGTARSWDGPIQEGAIIFHHKNFASDKFVIKFDYLKEYDVFTLVSLQNIYNDNIFANFYKDSTVYNFTNYTPDPNEFITITFFKPDRLFSMLTGGEFNLTNVNEKPSNQNENIGRLPGIAIEKLFSDKGQIENILKFQNNSDSIYFDMVYEILAREGYIFPDDDLNNKYRLESYYKPKRSITPSTMNKIESQIENFLDEKIH